MRSLAALVSIISHFNVYVVLARNKCQRYKLPGGICPDPERMDGDSGAGWRPTTAEDRPKVARGRKKSRASWTHHSFIQSSRIEQLHVRTF